MAPKLKANASYTVKTFLKLIEKTNKKGAKFSLDFEFLLLY